MMERKRNVLVIFPCDGPTRQRLMEAAGNKCEFVFQEPDWTEDDCCRAMEQAQIIIGEPKVRYFRYCKKLELMQSTCSGVNSFLESGLFPQGALMCCCTGEYGNIIAEHMLGMALALCRRLPEYRDQQHRHLWELRKYDKQLEGSALLILGAGDIGATLARWMRPMVGKIIGVRRVIREFPDCFDEMITLEALDSRLGEADLILCALPQTPETVGLLNRERLAKMKPDAVLVNGGRGSLIDQEALVELLEKGHFWGVGLEVTTPEPLPREHPLWEQPRVLITPHAAGNSFGPGSPLERRIWDFMIRNVTDFVNGRPVRNRVDFTTGYRETV